MATFYVAVLQQLKHRDDHCTVQLSADLIVVTGGEGTGDYVTSNGNETPLTPMGQGRGAHACGVYQDASGHQLRNRFEFVQA